MVGIVVPLWVVLLFTFICYHPSERQLHHSCRKNRQPTIAPIATATEPKRRYGIRRCFRRIRIHLQQSHSGILQRSKYFDINNGEIQVVLGCLKYMLEMSRSMSPNVTPEKVGVEDLGDYDSDIDIDT